MNRRAIAALAALLGASLFLSAPCAASAPVQQRGALPRGGSYVLDPDPSVGAAAVGLWFRAPGAGYDDASPGISRLAAVAAAAVPLASGKSLKQLVDSVGGDLNIDVYPDIVGIGAVVPSPAARRVIAAMTAAYFAPSLTNDSIKTSQRDAAVLAVQQRYNPDQTLHDLLFAHVFSAGPAHFPPLPDSVAALTKIPAADVSTFAKRAFRASNAVLTLAGNVDASSLDAVTDGDGKSSMDAPFASTLASGPAASTATGAVDGLGLAWVGPPIADEKAATALDFIADYLFREDSGVVSKAVDAGKGDTFVTGQFITLHDPGVMIVTISGDSRTEAKQKVLDAVMKLADPMDARTFNAAREAFLYHIAYDTQSPQEQADNLGWYSVEGSGGYAPGDAAGEYEKIARGLDPQFVADVVRRYLKNPLVVNLTTAPAGKESAS